MKKFGKKLLAVAIAVTLSVPAPLVNMNIASAEETVVPSQEKAKATDTLYDPRSGSCDYTMPGIRSDGASNSAEQAITAGAEIYFSKNINRNNKYNISEINLSEGRLTQSLGGNKATLESLSYSMMGGTELVLESEASATEEEKLRYTFCAENVVCVPMAKSTTPTKDEIDTVKELIIEYGAVETSYRYERGYMGTNPDCYFKDSADASSSNRNITIVGWDDEYKKTNFSYAYPRNPGAWLVRESQGSSFPSATGGGYFWLSYYERSLTQNKAYAVSYSSKNDCDYENIYQYDEGYKTDTTVSSTVQGNTIANVFHLDKNQTVKGASVYCPADSKCKIELYKKLSDPSNPTSGTAAFEALEEEFD